MCRWLVVTWDRQQQQAVMTGMNYCGAPRTGHQHHSHHDGVFFFVVVYDERDVAVCCIVLLMYMTGKWLCSAPTSRCCCDRLGVCCVNRSRMTVNYLQDLYAIYRD